MTKNNFTFKALNERGDLVNEVVSFECPDFQEKESVINLNGVEHKIITTIESQLIDWLDEQDKRSLMYEKDWYAIIDYSLEKPKTNRKLEKLKSKESIINSVLDIAKHYLSTCENGEQLLIDFSLVYSRLFENIKNLTYEQQFSSVLDTLNIGYEAKSEAYRSMVELLRGDTKRLGAGLTENKLIE